MAKAPGQLPTPAARRPSRKTQLADQSKQTKKQIAHGRREARQNRIIWLSVGAVALAILGILIAAVVNEAVVRPRRAVATVDGAKIPYNEYQALATYRRSNLEATINNLQAELQTLDPNDQNNAFLIQFYQQQVDALQSELAGVEESALNELIDDALIQEKAREAGLAVTAAEVTSTITEQLQQLAAASAPTPVAGTTAVLTPTLVPQSELDSIYESVLGQMSISEKDFRTIVRRGLLSEKVQELLASQVPTTGLVIHVQMIVTDTEPIAIAALARIENGEDFSTVAKDVSPSQAKDNGGDLGWVAASQLSTDYGQEVEALALSLQPGAVGRTSSGGRFYVIRVVERNENGPLPTEELDRRKSSALTDWLAERKVSPDVKIVRLLEATALPTSTSPPTEAPTAQATP